MVRSKKTADVKLKPKVKALLDGLIDMTGYSPEEIIIQGMLFDSPHLLSQLDIPLIRTWILLTNEESKFIDYLACNYNINRSELIKKILILGPESFL